MFSVRMTSNYNTNNSPIFNKQKTNNNSLVDSLNKNSLAKTRSDMRSLLAGLNDTNPTDYKMINGKKVFSQTSKDKVNGFLQLAGSSIDKELEAIKSAPKYKYKEVSSKIRSAKTSVSAGQALLSAKRNVSEIKRQLRSSKENSDELQLALSHAKRMEMAARKKKKHLETEELIENTKKLDEKLDKNESAGISEQEIRTTIIEKAEDELEGMEDEILEEREGLAEELSDSLRETGELSEEMMSELNNMIAEFSEDELKQLEENMEMLESIEVIDPHMSDEDFKKLKQKHRTSEEKTIMKADMEYLKDMIKLLEEKGSSISIGMAPMAFEASPVSFEVSV